MKLLLTLPLAVVLAIGCSKKDSSRSNGTTPTTDEPKTLTDAEIKRLLVGKWFEEIDDEGVKAKATSHYKKDGTFATDGTFDDGKKSLRIGASGTWKVSDGAIIRTVTKTSVPELINVGHVGKDQVLSIDDKVLKCKWENGRENMSTRVQE